MRPACVLELANTSTDSQSVTSGVLIMRKLWKRVDRATHRKLPSGPVPEGGRRRYSCNLASEPEIIGNCNCICAEVLQNRVRMSVCVSVCLKPFIQFLIGSKIPDSRFRKKVDQKMSARCEVRNSRISVRAYLRKFRAKREIC